MKYPNKNPVAFLETTLDVTGCTFTDIFTLPNPIPANTDVNNFYKICYDKTGDVSDHNAGQFFDFNNGTIGNEPSNYRNLVVSAGTPVFDGNQFISESKSLNVFGS